MAEKQQNEIDEFKQLIRELLASLGKITTEKDLRKAYRDHTGHNVNDKIHKVSVSLYVQTYQILKIS